MYHDDGNNWGRITAIPVPEPLFANAFDKAGPNLSWNTSVLVAINASKGKGVWPAITKEIWAALRYSQLAAIERTRCFENGERTWMEEKVLLWATREARRVKRSVRAVPYGGHTKIA